MTHFDKFSIGLLFLFISSFLAAESVVVLVFCEDTTEITIKDEVMGEYLDVHIGMELLAGDVIITKDSTAELEIAENGTVMKMGRNTTLSIESLGETTTPSYSFYMELGTLRTIAAKMTNNTPYTYQTPTAICSIRGTDFVIESVPGEKETLFVTDGLVEMLQLKTGAKLMVDKGKFANALAKKFIVEKITEKIQKRLQGEFDFKSKEILQKLKDRLENLPFPDVLPPILEKPLLPKFNLP